MESRNTVSEPFEPIFRINEAPFENLPTLGTFTYRSLSLPGDFNGSRVVDGRGINVLCFRLGQSHPVFELTSSETIELDDVTTLVERVMGTRFGDTDLDGDLDFADFLALSSNFVIGGNFSAGDLQVGFEDSLALSSNFGFNRSETAVSMVPEPRLHFGTLLVAGLMLGRRRKRTIEAEGRRPPENCQYSSPHFGPSKERRANVATFGSDEATGGGGASGGICYGTFVMMFPRTVVA